MRYGKVRRNVRLHAQNQAGDRRKDQRDGQPGVAEQAGREQTGQERRAGKRVRAAPVKRPESTPGSTRKPPFRPRATRMAFCIRNATWGILEASASKWRQKPRPAFSKVSKYAHSLDLPPRVALVRLLVSDGRHFPAATGSVHQQRTRLSLTYCSMTFAALRSLSWKSPQ